MRYYLSLLFCLIFASIATAQENPDPYEIALQRIEDAAATGTTFLNLGELALTEIPPEIGNLSSLKVLYLYNNQLRTLPAELSNLSNLETLHLNGNQFVSFPTEIASLTHLQSLDFSFNHLSSLPSEIANLNNLQLLYLSNNNLSSLPAEIGNLPYLVFLDLSKNQLSNLPAEIGNLAHLLFLNLSNNQLRSLVPEIANLPQLCHLDIRENPFERLPLELHSLRRLGTMADCSYGDGLLLDEQLLDTLPETVKAGGTRMILDYLENEVWWHLRTLIAGATGAIGLLGTLVLGWRWKNRHGKSKRKNQE